ncbi:hypothetical protein RJT34_06547 [Clitoria ternatea]|uniref:Uncharacterized protein n=1 Tax=Clitoria ternatea TaxID=43366 RepID=A0AAN9PUD5_CLITE
MKVYSLTFYIAYTTDGILSCGLTHMAVTHLDLVKCNMQIDPTKYKSILSGFGVLLKEQGVKAFSMVIADVEVVQGKSQHNFLGGWLMGILEERNWVLHPS